MYTRKRRSFKVTPGKLEELWERLVEMRGTPEIRGEPKRERNICLIVERKIQLEIL